MIVYIIIFILSLAVLLLASDWFVGSAEKIGLSFGVSPFIIGVTIVAFGTSLPELATSIASVFTGYSEIVIGNVVGSNITNILLVLGLTAVLGKGINLEFNIWNIDMPILFISAFLLFFAVGDLEFGMIETGIFILGLVVFLLNSVSGEKSEVHKADKARPLDYAKLVVSGVLVYFGAEYTITAIEYISETLSINPEIIALTAVALGTSLPEVVVSIAAVRRGKNAIAVGNVLGSNIFNTYAVMAIPSMFGPLTIPEHVVSYSVPFMLVVTVIFGITTFTRVISKWEGYMLILIYIYYLSELLRGII